MAGFTLSEKIGAPREQVFKALMDPEQAPRIMPNIQIMEAITPRPIEVGTRFLEKRLVEGKLRETELEVVEYQAPLRYGVSAEQSGITVAYHYNLRPSDGGTQVDLESAVDGKGAKKLMLPIVAGIMKKKDGNHLAHLKTALETQRG